MGRPRKPNTLKLLEGDQPCRIRGDGPDPPGGVGPCPDHLDDVAREAWGRVAASVEETGLLTLADAETLALYCSTYSRWRSACEALAREGLTITSSLKVETEKRTTTRETTKVHPLLQVATESSRQMTTLLKQLGMTPASRSSLHVERKPAEDALLDFVANKPANHDKKA